DHDVLDRQVLELLEQLAGHGPVARPHLDYVEGIRPVQRLPRLPHGRSQTGREHPVNVRARDEVAALADGRTVVEPARRVQRELHELGERDGAAILDRPADPGGYAEGLVAHFTAREGQACAMDPKPAATVNVARPSP